MCLLSHAASEAAGELFRVSDAEFDALLDKLRDLPALDLCLQVELPKLVSPALDRLCDAVADDDPEAAEHPFGEILGQIDTPLERARIGRARIGRAVIALRARGELDRQLAASALIELASRSRELVGASLLEAVAVRVGAARTPAGIMLAA